MEMNAYLIFKRAKVQMAIDDYNYSEIHPEQKMEDVLKTDSPYYKMVSCFSFNNVANVLRTLHQHDEHSPEDYRLCDIEMGPSLEDCLMYAATQVIINAITHFKEHEGDTFYYEGPWYILKGEDEYTLHYTIEDSY